LRTCPLAFSFAGHIPNGLSASAVATAAVAANDITITLTGDFTTYCVAGGSLGRGSKIRLTVTATGADAGAYTVQGCGALNGGNTPVYVYEPMAAVGAAPTVYFEAKELDGSTTTYSSTTDDFGQWDANNAHGLAECAGQGICDRSTGQCNCFPGYEGESCTRTVCPNSCSGHGICISAARMASDFSQTYNQAWDSNKHFGCKCDVGFRGPDCSLQECPSDFDPLNGCGGGRCNNGGFYQNRAGTWTICPNRATVSNAIGAQTNLNQYEIDTSDCLTGEQRDCSGRGICDYSTGSCKCFSGFFGESCNIQTVLV